MKTTYLIVPALTDQAGQCRIVRTFTQLGACDPLTHYRRWPEDWGEVGLMNSSGKLICFDGPQSVCEEIESCQPLMAGLVFTYEVPPAPIDPYIVGVLKQLGFPQRAAGG
ncbi:hypothetical protein [Piscinibacter gummiphilus]|uniref:Uncharacterized protein n=1 Tax=Piscinibacter gummiphilus TaxID=946333 RepID=A0ABZ0CNC5_9BURK|nr:hypothetical protein [Piscinibacter gummiphilus]WOB06496.1 hypothetical protein RXV79_16360 [Piscinibacter gummiphilus]